MPLEPIDHFMENLVLQTLTVPINQTIYLESNKYAA
jgi:hypothetical protein